MRVLLGYDGSKESHRALQGLALAGLPSDLDALVATVTTPWPDIHPEFLAGSSFHDQAARKLGKLFPSWRAGAECRRPLPHRQQLLRRGRACCRLGRSRPERRWNEHTQGCKEGLAVDASCSSEDCLDKAKLFLGKGDRGG